jgi:hypothetical protein
MIHAVPNVMVLISNQVVHSGVHIFFVDLVPG